MIAAILLVACGTLEDNAWTSGVSREDALGIKSALEAQKKANAIYSYSRDADGSILVQSDVGWFKAQRIHGKWMFRQVFIVVWELHSNGLTMRSS